ncbi:MAG: HAD family hydrolase [Planctomycetaceae bacterium]|nr:HAD family hydrolase [Planctomycetaceae bacterium]
MPLNLVVFDLDGTLVQSMNIEDLCFVRALQLAWQISDVDTNWNHYQHVTETAIADDLFRARYGRSPDESEISELQSVFASELNVALQHTKLKLIPGADRALEALKGNPCWQAAIATGTWDCTCRLKAAAVGLPLEQLPVATADDGRTRSEIVRTAIQRASQHCGIRDFHRIICVGDGLWDVKTAVLLDLPIIGVAHGPQADLLHQAGAVGVISDFQDLHHFLSLLEQIAEQDRNDE